MRTKLHKVRIHAGSFFVTALVVSAGLVFSALRSYNQPAHLSVNGQHKPFTIVALPDTQNYTIVDMTQYSRQTKWIVSTQPLLNTVFVTHLGDIVQDWDSTQEWQGASQAMSALDGKIQYGIAPGNHDFDTAGDPNQFSKYFPLTRLSRSPYWQEQVQLPFISWQTADFGSYGAKNSYNLFSASGMKFVALNLEFCPTDDVLTWASSVLGRYSDRTAIVSTHSFTRYDGERERADHSCNVYHAAGRNAGEDIWQKLVVRDRHTNILLFLSGHDIWSDNGAARRTDFVDGKPIHQLLSNYQQFPDGGSGFLRMMRFDPTRGVLEVRTYSPTLDQYFTDPGNQFDLPLR